MKIIEGNSYVCIKEWKDTKGRAVPVGAIYYAGKDGLCGYNNEGVYSNITPMEDYGEYFTLFDETPYNKELRELRERYAGMVLQGMMANKVYRAMPDDVDSTENDLILQELAAKRAAYTAIKYTDALLEELRKEV